MIFRFKPKNPTRIVVSAILMPSPENVMYSKETDFIISFTFACYRNCLAKKYF